MAVLDVALIFAVLLEWIHILPFTARALVLFQM